MKLPNAHLAAVDQRKITEYLLNPAHPGNGAKARFFQGLGFSADDVPKLIEALCRVAERGETMVSVESVHGAKYVIDGALESQTGAGSERIVRTIWVIEPGDIMPRLVSAYSAED